MMLVLGVFAEGPNPAAALLANGELVAFCEEERFTRIKTAPNSYPLEASRFCLDSANARPSDIAVVSFGWNATKYDIPKGHQTSPMGNFYQSLSSRFDKDVQTIESEQRILERFQSAEIRKKLLKMLNVIDPAHCFRGRFNFVEHHMAHAASAYFLSGFDDAAVLTMDGSGEEICIAFWIGKSGMLQRRQYMTIPQSLGWFYSSFCEYLGFIPNQQEGKLMALAAYGQPNEKILTVINRACKQNVKSNSFDLDPTYIWYGEHNWGTRFTDKLVRELGEPRRVGEVYTKDDADIAYAVQNKLENVVMSLVRKWMPKSGVRNLCLAGGVCLNCKLNGHLAACQKEGIIEKLFIQPVSSDAGTALGAGLLASAQSGIDPRFEMTNPYWGPEYSDATIRKTIRGCGLKTENVNVAAEAAKLIKNGAILGLFQGRSEAGPRSLGNRSILADPRNPLSPRRVNSKVKDRESWRPFAPSILRNSEHRYFNDYETAPFMIRSFVVRNEVRRLIPAVVHVDGSTRPQSVCFQDNPFFFELIKQFDELAGVPILLNTSFNGPGQPIVNSPEEAIRLYLDSDLDALILGRHLIVKPQTALTPHI